MHSYTVVIATHNRPALLRRAIISVKEQAAGIAQLIVVSDSRCKTTFDVADALLDGEDQFIQRWGAPGPAESRNLGIRLSTGRFIVFLDDDDALSPNYLNEALGHADPDAVIYTDFANILERREPDLGAILSCQCQSLAGFDVKSLFLKNFIPPACLVYPRDAIIARGFDPLVDYEDWDFLLNVAQDYPFRHVPINGPLVYSRERPDNRGNANDGRLEQTYRRVYKKWPAPTQQQKLARQDLLRSAGLSASLEDL